MIHETHQHPLVVDHEALAQGSIEPVKATASPGFVTVGF